MNADGSGQRQLTQNQNDDILPDWSPNGNRIAFVSQRDKDFEICALDYGSLGYQPSITWYAGVASKVAGLGGIPGLEKVAQQWSTKSAAEASIYVTQELLTQRKALVPLAA